MTRQSWLPRYATLVLPSTLLLIASLNLSCARAPQGPSYRNLVIIMIDTLRSDHLPSYGYERDTAPFLAELAAEGIQVQGYSASSWTKPSIATLMTGLHPQRHQAISRSDKLPEGLDFLPQLLDNQGFVTAAFISNRNASRPFGFHRGYDAFDQTSGGKKPAARVTDRALGQLDAAREAEGDGPVFLYVHYTDPHDPYRPRRPWGAEEDVKPLRRMQPQRLLRRNHPLNDETLQYLINAYDGEIREMDVEIRRLFDELDARGLLDDTLVVVTADHGEEFGEHGMLTHGITLYEEVLRVPFVLWARDGLPSYQSPDRFHQVDFLPTVLDAMQLDEPLPELGGRHGLDGASRWTELLAGTPPNDEAEGGTYYFHMDLDERGLLASTQWPRKLIHRWRAPHDLSFDLELDPEERLAQEPSNDDPLAALLRHHNRLGVLAAERQKTELDDETRGQLAALGYLELDTPDEELGQRVMPRQLPRDGGFAALAEEAAEGYGRID